MTFGTLLWESVILTSVTLLLRDLAGIGSAPRYGNVTESFLGSSGLSVLLANPCFYRGVELCKVEKAASRKSYRCNLLYFFPSLPLKKGREGKANPNLQIAKL